MNKIGISFGSLCDSKEERLDFIKFPYECVEIPALEKSKMDRIVNRCRENNLEFAIHYPSQYSVRHLEFDLFHKEQCDLVLDDFSRYVENYSDASYYLIHFPSSKPKEYDIEIYMGIIDKLNKRFSNIKNRLVIENLSILSVKDYEQILRYGNNWLCLDIGHAFLLGMTDLLMYFERLGDRIKVIHYYNTSNSLECLYYGKHISFSINADSIIDKATIDKKIDLLSNEVYIINEMDYRFSDNAI